jgi:hypothetical protein
MPLLEYQVVLGAMAAFIGLAGYAPYLINVVRRQTKPHAFSWLIWGLLQSIVFFASTSKGGGAGAWAIGAPAALNLLIFAIALFVGEKEITRMDKASLALAFLGMALWVATTDPVWSVIILTGVDVLGLVPTLRKAYARPGEESISVFAFSAVSFFISLFAVQSVSLTTVLYPSAVAIGATVLVVMVLARRRMLS